MGSTGQLGKGGAHAVKMRFLACLFLEVEKGRVGIVYAHLLEKNGATETRKSRVVGLVIIVVLTVVDILE